MTRRHFRLIADTLACSKPDVERGEPGDVQWRWTVDNFARQLAGTNGRFDADKFKAACGVEGYAPAKPAKRRKRAA